MCYLLVGQMCKLLLLVFLLLHHGQACSHDFCHHMVHCMETITSQYLCATRYLSSWLLQISKTALASGRLCQQKWLMKQWLWCVLAWSCLLLRDMPYRHMHTLCPPDTKWTMCILQRCFFSVLLMLLAHTKQSNTTFVNSVVCAQHHAAVRQLAAKHGGYESNTEGDSFLLAFHRASDAASFGTSLQLELLAVPWPQELLNFEVGCCC